MQSAFEGALEKERQRNQQALQEAIKVWVFLNKLSSHHWTHFVHLPSFRLSLSQEEQEKSQRVLEQALEEERAKAADRINAEKVFHSKCNYIRLLYTYNTVIFPASWHIMRMLIPACYSIQEQLQSFMESERVRSHELASESAKEHKKMAEVSRHPSVHLLI